MKTYPTHSDIQHLAQTKKPSGKKRSIALLATVATFGSLLFGYDTGVIAGALPYMDLPFAAGGLALTTVERGAVGAILAIGAAFGAFFGGRLSDKYGRRHNILLLAWVFIIGTLGCTFSINIAMLYISRFILGMAVGGASATVPVFLSENAPTHIRGALVAVDQFMIVVGQLLAYSMNAVLSYVHGGPSVVIAHDPSGVYDDGQTVAWDSLNSTANLVFAGGNGSAWRWMLVLATIPAVVLWVGMRLLPESSRWYAANGNYLEAIGALKRIRPGSTGAESPDEQAAADHAVAEEIYEMVELNRIESRQEKWTLLEVVASTWTRKILLIGIGLACFDQLTGINTAMYYLPTILRGAGFSSATSIQLNVWTGVASCIGAGFGFWLLTRLKRRHVGMYQEAGVSLSLFALALIFGFGLNRFIGNDGVLAESTPAFLPWMVVVLIGVFVFMKQSGTVNWVLLSEIFPARIRGVAQGAAVACGWLMNAVVTWVFPLMFEHMGAASTYAVFGVINVVAFIFYWKIVPETKEYSLESVETRLRGRFS